MNRPDARLRRPRRGPLVTCVIAAMFVASSASAEDDPELAALLAMLDEETEIATKSRMNSDFVPGMVTVLDGGKLAALGFRTVGEALVMVPGVQATQDAFGTATSTVRGIPFPFNSGGIQVLLNGVAIGREDAGSNGSALLLPIAQIERLEFIRGPGSVLYGDFAFQGLLNIITRHSGRLLQVETDSHGSRSANVLVGGDIGEWQLSGVLGALDSHDAILPTPRSGEERRHNAVLAATRERLSLQLHALQRDLDALRGGPPNERGFDESSWSAALRYDQPVADALDARVRLQYLDTDIAANVSDFAGRQLRGSVEIEWAGWSRQQWLFGVEASRGRVDRARFMRPPPPGQPGPPTWVDVDPQTRRVHSLFLQDQIELMPALRATLGLRYDDNSEIGERVTPRASLVWQPAEQHLLKLQYAEGYRPPTFFERYTDGPVPNMLDFEVNATTELSYIHRRPGSTLRATVFRARITDMVFRNQALRRFDNFASADSDGVELEWTQRIGDEFEIDASLTHADARDNRNFQQLDQPIGSVPDWIGNLGLRWRPRSDVDVGLVWTHVGERDVIDSDAADFDRVDLSLGWRGRHGFGLRVGLDNLLREETIQVRDNPMGGQLLRFRDRVAWAQLEVEW